MSSIRSQSGGILCNLAFLASCILTEMFSRATRTCASLSCSVLWFGGGVSLRHREECPRSSRLCQAHPGMGVWTWRLLQTFAVFRPRLWLFSFPLYSLLPCSQWVFFSVFHLVSNFGSRHFAGAKDQKPYNYINKLL